jgi:hypothetical protein
MKYKWRVSEEPSGSYASFSNRSWPSAYYENGDVAASITCMDDPDYRPSKVRTGDHGELTLMIADHSEKPSWRWKKSLTTYKTLQDAKDGFERILQKHPQIAPQK